MEQLGTEKLPQHIMHFTFVLMLFKIPEELNSQISGAANQQKEANCFFLLSLCWEITSPEIPLKSSASLFSFGLLYYYFFLRFNWIRIWMFLPFHNVCEVLCISKCGHLIWGLQQNISGDYYEEWHKRFSGSEFLPVQFYQKSEGIAASSFFSKISGSQSRSESFYDRLKNLG